MKSINILIMMTVGFMLIACQKKEERSKIIHSFPTDVSTSLVPVNGLQQYVILNNRVFGMAGSFIDRMRLYSSPSYPELTSLGGGRYRWQLSDAHAGTAFVDFLFFNGSQNPIDPVATPADGLTLGSIAMEVTQGATPQFSYSSSLSVTLAVSGVLTSERLALGTATFSGSSYVMNFSIAAGSRASGNGLVSGISSVTGSGPSEALSGTLSYDLDHNTNGSLVWENQQGNIHLDSEGIGMFVTDISRSPLP